MIGLRALAKSCKSGPGAQGSQIAIYSEGYDGKMIGLGALAKSWKSGPRTQGSQICWANTFFSLPIKIPPQIYLIAPFSPTTFVPKATFC